MRIANWNLERIIPNQSRASAIRDHMAAVGADVWVLTETHECFSPGNDFNAVLSGEPDRISKPGERWVGIWSRTLLESLPSFVSDETRCAAARMVHPEHGEAIVFGCVLPWGGSTWQGIPSSNGAAFSAAVETYRENWLRLRRAFPNALLIVAGDFNQSLVRWHYYGSSRQRKTLELSLAETGLVVTTAGANDPIARDSAPCACIDHICISDSLDIVIGSTIRWPEAARPDKRLSDHFGVAVDVLRS